MKRRREEEKRRERTFVFVFFFFRVDTFLLSFVLSFLFFFFTISFLSLSHRFESEKREKSERSRGRSRERREGEKTPSFLSLPLSRPRPRSRSLPLSLSLKLHLPPSPSFVAAAAACSLSHFGEYTTGTASSFAARDASASVIPPAACVVASTRTRFHSVRWKSGWWPAASATSAAADRNATAAAKFFARHSRDSRVPSGERRQAGKERSLASRSARERSGVSLLLLRDVLGKRGRGFFFFLIEGGEKVGGGASIERRKKKMSSLFLSFSLPLVRSSSQRQQLRDIKNYFHPHREQAPTQSARRSAAPAPPSKSVAGSTGSGCCFGFSS